MFLNDLSLILNELIEGLNPLEFSPPVTHVYNPLVYARQPYEQYLKKYAAPTGKIILLGMNPGPWGMAQTGIPFGEIHAAKQWLKIEAPVGSPEIIHPKRPILGFSCRRSEISGKRLWGWAREKFGTPEIFFSRFLVLNYCPLIFFEESGRNRTPNTICAKERLPLLSVCDHALRQTIQVLTPSHVLGIGNFAFQQAEKALRGMDVKIGRITHPSPANPKANRGWSALIDMELRQNNIQI